LKKQEPLSRRFAAGAVVPSCFASRPTAQFGESGQWIRSKAAGSPGSLSVSRGQGNQVAALVRIPPLLDGPLRAMLCPLWMSLS
jgi:hypothetical protein